ncbi:MAG: hypothetical protein U5K81_13170 [Trueperaceae bacterium]|nr:hypothetical protein [Trueperaceae bacterium]
MNPRALERFDRALEALAGATGVAKPLYRPKVLANSEGLLRDVDGASHLYARVPALIEAGMFEDGPWERPDRLVPSLVAGTLRAGGETTLMELLSELRMLALATGKVHHREVDVERATAFLEEVMVLNLDLVFPSGSEAERHDPQAVVDKTRVLFDLVLQHVPLDSVQRRLSREVDMIMHQRPIVTQRARTMIAFARRQFPLDRDDPDDQVLLRYMDAIDGPTALSRELPDHGAYGEVLAAAEEDVVQGEAWALGRSMLATGLVSAHHAVLLRQVREHPELVASALQLSDGGRQQLADHHGLIVEIIDAAIHPVTEQAVLGLSEALNAGLFARAPVRQALSRLSTLDVHPEVAADVCHSAPGDLPARHLLLADALSVLGQPLGVSQGWSPTCQSARGISLWSQYAPGKLLDMVITVAQSNRLEMRFESHTLDSSTLSAGLATEIDYSLDAVSTVLVPHLDRLYNHMMKLAGLRADDPHKWVNPALYGHWIPTGFFSAFDPITQSIQNYDAFVRTFYASHHPGYNGGHDLAYPSPVGLFITSASADLLGFHAVSLLRVAAPEPGGEMRAYFLNPNAEGRQDWGMGVEPTVHGHGERPGESSLPFEHFVSRLYAYHYNPNDLGDTAAVGQGEVDRVTRQAKESWGTAYVWPTTSVLQ